MSILPSILDEFVCRPGCRACDGSGTVCEDHPGVPWEDGDGCCGAAGMPCTLRHGVEG